MSDTGVSYDVTTEEHSEEHSEEHPEEHSDGVTMLKKAISVRQNAKNEHGVILKKIIISDR